MECPLLFRAAMPLSTMTACRPADACLADMDRAIDRRLFAVAVAAFLTYAGLFVARTSFVVGGERYFSLFDDAMVSMRYARNFAEGYGLVWNPGGERVEGYTNPLWVLYMSLIHFFPVAPSKTSLFVQISAALFLAANLYYTRRIALAISSGSRMVTWGAIALTATYLPINHWSLQGMEVSVLLLLMSACTWLGVNSLNTGVFPKHLYVLLGIATWVRPDMVVPYVAFFSFMLVADPGYRRRHAIQGLGILAFALAAQTAFRLLYYGDVLPNTYYLKMTGVPLAVRVAHGAYVLLLFVWKANPLLFGLAFALVLRNDRRIWLLFWTVAVQMAYSVYVGGDAWEYWGGANRFIAIAMPAFCVLLSHALQLTTSALITVAGTGLPGNVVRVRRMAAAAFALAVVYAGITMNSIHGINALAEVVLLQPALHTGNGGRNQRDVAQALLLRQATTPDATIAVTRAGTIPYFANRTAVDLLGKNDRFVAHEPVATFDHLRFTEFRPGHMKFDYAYSIGYQQPDVIFHLGRPPDRAMPFLKDVYADVQFPGGCVFARRGSAHLLWDRMPPYGCGHNAAKSVDSAID